MEKAESSVQAVVVNLSNQPKLYPDQATVYSASDVIPFGSDNLFPQAIALIGRTSPNHRGVLNYKTIYMMGSGIVTEDGSELPMLDEINAEGESLDDVIEKLLFDFNMLGNAYCEIITDTRHSFCFLNHLDCTKVRRVKDQTRISTAKDDIDWIVMHPNWAEDIGRGDNRRCYLPLYPDFQPYIADNGAKILRAVFHFKDYEPEFKTYGIPLWIAGKDAAEIDFKTNKWNLSRLENSFRVSGILVIPVTDEAEGKKVLQNIASSNIGEGKQAKLLAITKTRARENEKADTTQLIETKQDDDGSWINLHRQSLSDVVVSHGWYRSLSGISDNTGFDTKRILNEYNIALATVIKKKQKKFLKFIHKVFKEVQGMDLTLKFVNRPPLDDFSFHYIWEAREAQGLEADPGKVEQQAIIQPK